MASVICMGGASLLFLRGRNSRSRRMLAFIMMLLSVFTGAFYVGQSRSAAFRWLRPIGAWLIGGFAVMFGGGAPDFLMGVVTAGLVVLCGFTVHTVKLVLAAAILWVVNPVSAHLIARMEVITGLGLDPDQLPGEGEQEL